MISVLMSVYNETPEDITKSINSVLSQTFTDFELIVVLDNPENSQALSLLNDFAKKDARVVVVVNEKNIGLALSMNRAASVAKGEFFLRMDADDICVSDRFELQFEAISNSNYDLICSSYDFIDENGNPLDQKAPFFTSKQINLLLPLRNVIHHPTIIMKRDVFEKAGGYRNYQCAQDYDLWLRLKLLGCKFCMMPQKLLHYRVRTSSTTVKHRYKQVCTLRYILSLYGLWGLKGMRGYSYEGYLSYLETHGASNPEVQENYKENFSLYMSSIAALRQKRLVEGIKGVAKVLFCSKYYRPHILRSLKIAVIKKCFK